MMNCTGGRWGERDAAQGAVRLKKARGRVTDPTRRGWKFQSIRRFVGPGGPCQFSARLERGTDALTDLQMEASDLLDYRAFREHVLKTTGRLVRFTEVEDAPDPAIAWLDLIETALPDEPLRRPT
jgi:hypothetical protein